MNTSIAITTYNRNHLLPRLVSSFDKFEDVVIWNDGGEFNEEAFNDPFNRGALIAKYKAINACKNDWIFLADSDNRFDDEFCDRLKQIKPQLGTLYIPCNSGIFGWGEFIHSKIDLKRVKNLLNRSEIQVFLDMGNFLVNKLDYNEVYSTIDEYYTCDAMAFTSHWLMSGRSIEVVEGWSYEHGTLPDSYFIKNKMRNLNERNKLLYKIYTKCLTQ